MPITILQPDTPDLIVQDEQPGGWHNIIIALPEEISFSPVILTNKNSNTVVYNSSSSDIDIYPVAENIKISEKSSRNKSGTLYNIKIDVQIDNQSTFIDDHFLKYHLKKVVVFGIKHFSQQKIYGSKKFPLLLSYKFVNGDKFEKGSKTMVTISGKIPQKPVFIND